MFLEATAEQGGSPSDSGIKNPSAMQEMQEMLVQFLGWEDPGEGCGYPLQYSLLGNHMDKGVWKATVHSIIKSWT